LYTQHYISAHNYCQTWTNKKYNVWVYNKSETSDQQFHILSEITAGKVDNKVTEN